MSDTPIEDYLDELLRRTRADARTTRRLLDEASDHLYATAAELESAGASRVDAERDAVRRFGPSDPLRRAAMRRSFRGLVLETARAAILLGGFGLVAVGLSGLVALAMNLIFGRSFVGGVKIAPFTGAPIDEAADDAVVLRVLAGVVGLVVVLGYGLLRRRFRAAPVLPAGLVDALAAAAFAAATAGLAIGCTDQAVQNGADGVGFFLSGALVSLVGAVVFSARAARALLPAR